MVPASQLRIYEPLGSFPAVARRHWARYIESELPSTAAWTYRQTCVHHGGAAVGLLYPVRGEHAYLRRVGGAWMVCPWSVQVSVLTAILAFREEVPSDLADVLVPDEAADWAAGELDQLRQEDPAAHDHVASAAWHVPFRWLAAFDDAERILTAERSAPRVPPARPAAERAAVRLRYETDLSLGLARLRRASSILVKAGMHEEIVDPLDEMAEWMGHFHPDSLVELDYAGLAALISAVDLETDRSAGEIWACLEALELGDVDESRRRYDRLAAWWDGIRAVERLN